MGVQLLTKETAIFSDTTCRDLSFEIAQSQFISVLIELLCIAVLIVR